MLVQRSVVGGRVDDVKTEYSKDDVPLDARLAEALLSGALLHSSRETRIGFLPIRSREGRTTRRACRKSSSNGLRSSPDLGEDIGWHTFRHTYRSWLDETGAPMKVQQELMRHASIQTTMNVYGRAMTETKRRANSQVVGLVFGPNSQDSPENAGVATVQ